MFLKQRPNHTNTNRKRKHQTLPLLRALLRRRAPQEEHDLILSTRHLIQGIHISKVQAHSRAHQSSNLPQHSSCCPSESISYPWCLPADLYCAADSAGWVFVYNHFSPHPQLGCRSPLFNALQVMVALLFLRTHHDPLMAGDFLTGLATFLKAEKKNDDCSFSSK